MDQDGVYRCMFCHAEMHALARWCTECHEDRAPRTRAYLFTLRGSPLSAVVIAHTVSRARAFYKHCAGSWGYGGLQFVGEDTRSTVQRYESTTAAFVVPDSWNPARLKG